MSLFDRLKDFVDRIRGIAPEPPPPPPPPPPSEPPPPPPPLPRPEEPIQPTRFEPDQVGTPERPYDGDGMIDLIWVLDHEDNRFNYDKEDWRKPHENFESALNYANDLKDKGLPTIVFFDGEEWHVIVDYDFKYG